MVGTVKKSMDTVLFTWLSRKVRHVCEGGFPGRTNGQCCTSLIRCGVSHDQTAAGPVQIAALRTRNHYLRRPLVSAVLAFLSRSRGVAPGTRSPCGPHHHLALGAALCP